MNVSFRVNGKPVKCAVEPRKSLLDCLREDLRLYGTHVGCEHGVCGCCNVIVDGALVRSCLMFATQARNAEVRTIEGVESEAGLHPIQEAFCRHHAMQCGYCTPGMIMSLVALLEETPTPSEEQLIESVSSNLCRCTGYQQILEAARSVIAPASTTP
ncbi:MAG: (2Fe-2S)-binding protein [Casimicrobiaceae bacterium]